MSTHRVVLKDLRAGPSGGIVVVASGMSQKEAERIQKLFMKAKWDPRRPGIFTIDHVALCVEPL